MILDLKYFEIVKCCKKLILESGTYLNIYAILYGPSTNIQ